MKDGICVHIARACVFLLMYVCACACHMHLTAVTGNALDEDQAAFLCAGANRVLTKPLAKSILADTLKELLHT